MKLKAAGYSDMGKFRKLNDDTFVSDPVQGLFIVCDGSTSPFGKEASELTCKKVREVVSQNIRQIEGLLSSERQTERAKAQKYLETAVQAACSAVYQLIQDDPRKQGIYTTVDVVLATQGQLLAAHVGDGRIYLLRGGNLRKITTDHTYQTEMIKEFALSPEEAAKRPYSQILTRNLGQTPFVSVDIVQLDAMAGDLLLICTDGLSDYFPAAEFAELTRPTALSLEKLPKLLTEAAQKRGSKDNVTALILQIDPEDEVKKVSTLISDKFEMIRSIRMFQFLSYNEMMKVLSIVNIVKLEPGMPVVEEGKKSDEMFIVLKGEVTISINGEKIAQGGRGEVIGEMGLFDNTPRSATVKAMNKTELLALGRKDLFKLMRENRELATKFCWGVIQELGQRIRQRSDQLASLQQTQRSTSQQLEVPFFDVEI